MRQNYVNVAREMRYVFYIPLLLGMFFQDAQAQLAEGKCKFLGNVIGNSVPTSFTTYWDQVTPENSGKWGSVEGTRDNMSWGGLQTAYDFAKNNGFPFKQHTFIWGNQQPSWIETLSQEEQLEEITEWISAYCEKFPETDYIEVVNEPINDPPNTAGSGGGNYINALGGTGTTGYDWIVTSFEMAREYCPNAKLLINEYNVINNNARTDQYINIINILKDRELIDGIGIQAHRFEVESTPETQMDSNLDKLGATGLPVYITEFDLGNLENSGTPDDSEQLELYKDVFPVLWEHPAVHGVTIWGYLQGQTWQETAYLLNTNGTERPALSWLKTYVEGSLGGTFCLNVTGLDDEELSMNIYPNPSNEGNITLKLTESIQNIQVLDNKGSVLKDLRVTGGIKKLDLELNLPAGIYFLKLQGADKTTFEKLLVK